MSFGSEEKRERERERKKEKRKEDPYQVVKQSFSGIPSRLDIISNYSIDIHSCRIY